MPRISPRNCRSSSRASPRRSIRSEVSTVDEVGDGIARVTGLKSAMAGELLEFKSSDTGETVFGLAQNLDRDEVGAVLFGAVDAIKEGDECRTMSSQVPDTPLPISSYPFLQSVFQTVPAPLYNLLPPMPLHLISHCLHSLMPQSAQPYKELPPTRSVF